ncbi:hypothetical protein Ndes2526A_g07274 [Nannochloris sp. 'desiccata']
MVSLKSTLHGTMPAALNRNNLFISHKTGSFTPIFYLPKLTQSSRDCLKALSLPTCLTGTTSGDESPRLDHSAQRRSLLTALCLLAATPTNLLPALALETTALFQADIDLSLAPDQSLYDAADPRLRAAAALVQDALKRGRYVVGRAWGNRGNARARQGKLQEALSDYNTAIKLCPWSVDPVLNRGVTLEALERFPEAIADYKAVLKVAPDDPSAWNNYGKRQRWFR